MSIYKTYEAIIKKRYPIVILYLLILLFLSYFLSNSTQDSSYSGYEQTRVGIAIFNHEKDQTLAQEMISYMSEFCDIVSLEDSKEAKENALNFRNVYYIVTIPEGYTKALSTNQEMQLIVEAVKNSKEANYANQALMGLVNQIKAYQKKQPKQDIHRAIKLAREQMSINVSVQNNEKHESLEKKTNHHMNLFGFVLLACLLNVITDTISTYRTEAIYRRHQITPISDSKLSFKLLACSFRYAYTFSMIYFSLFMFLYNEMKMNLQNFLYFVNLLVFVTTVVCFAFYLAHFLKQRRMLGAIVLVIALVLSIVSGVFISQEYLSDDVIKLSSMTPLYWYVRGNAVIQGYHLNTIKYGLEFASICAIQIVFSVTYFMLTLVLRKIKKIEQ